jgi:hypothetical protein
MIDQIPCNEAGKCLMSGACKIVPAGFYSPAGVQSCLVCIGSVPGASTCNSCSAAGVCLVPVPGTDLKQCGLSPPGFYGPQGTEDCRPCPAKIVFGDDGYCNAVCDKEGECAWQGKCTVTPPGYYSYNGTSECIPCLSALTSGLTACPLEKAGTKDCSAAGQCVAGGLCGPAPAGFYSPVGISACVVCIGAPAGSSSCTSCKDVGVCFSVVTGTTDLQSCALSPPGYYGPEGADDCQICKTSTTYGDDGRCTPECNGQTTCLYEGKCKTTPPGYYSYEGTSQCIPCASASTEGSSSCRVVLAGGTRGACTGKGKCLIGGSCVSPPGGFFASPGAEECLVCIGALSASEESSRGLAGPPGPIGIPGNPGPPGATGFAPPGPSVALGVRPMQPRAIVAGFVAAFAIALVLDW